MSSGRIVRLQTYFSIESVVSIVQIYMHVYLCVDRITLYQAQEILARWRWPRVLVLRYVFFEPRQNAAVKFVTELGCPAMFKVMALPVEDD